MTANRMTRFHAPARPARPPSVLGRPPARENTVLAEMQAAALAARAARVAARTEYVIRGMVAPYNQVGRGSGTTYTGGHPCDVVEQVEEVGSEIILPGAFAEALYADACGKHFALRLDHAGPALEGWMELADSAAGLMFAFYGDAGSAFNTFVVQRILAGEVNGVSMLFSQRRSVVTAGADGVRVVEQCGLIDIALVLGPFYAATAEHLRVGERQAIPFAPVVRAMQEFWDGRRRLV